MERPARAPRQLSRREREQARHRREILEAAVRLFADHGYHETTMQMVADAAGYSVGFLYKHFHGKEEMYEEMIAFHVGRMEAIMGQVRSLGLPPLDELRAAFAATCDHFNDHRHYMRIYLKVDAGRSMLVDRKRRYFAFVADRLQKAVDAGELRPVDAGLLAAMVQGAYQELFHELAGRDVARPFDTLTDTLFAYLIDPLRP